MTFILLLLFPYVLSLRKAKPLIFEEHLCSCLHCPTKYFWKLVCVWLSFWGSTAYQPGHKTQGNKQSTLTFRESSLSWPQSLPSPTCSPYILSSSKCSYIYELCGLKSIISDDSKREQDGFHKLQWIQLCMKLSSGVFEWLVMANIKCWLVRLQSEVFTESFVDGHLPKHGSSPCHLPHSRIFSALTLCLPLDYSSNYIVFLTQLWQLPGPHTANPWRSVFHLVHAVILLALQQFSYLYASPTHCTITFLTSFMASPFKWELMVLSISLAIHPAACKNVWVWMNQRCSRLWKFNQHSIITQI